MELQFSQLLDIVCAGQSAYHKLVIIVGPSGSGKTRLLNRLTTALKMPVINLNLEVSQRLLNLSKRQRMLKAEEVARDVIDEQNQSDLCLDNIELLFDSSLRLNPLVLLQNLSRNRRIVASWNGVLEGGELRFGYPGHPDFFKQTISGCPVVTVSDDKLQLYLTA